MGYKTFCGGIVSLLTITLIGFFSATEIWNFLHGNKYNESIGLETLNYNNTLSYTVNETSATVAF